MDLTVQQLRVLVEVADSGSFTAAGEQLGLGQSSLSRTVADLERRLGIRLFERTTRRVVPTPEGVELVRVARGALASFDRAMAHFDGYLAGSRGVVRVAALPSLAAILLPGLLAAFRVGHPDVRVEIEDGLLAQVHDAVASGAVDLAFTAAPDPGSDLVFTPVVADEFHAVFPAGHPLDSTAPVSWHQLAGLPFVRLHPSSSVREHVDRLLLDADVQLGATTEVRNIAAVGGLVAAGLGVSAVPGLVLPLLQFAGLKHRPLVDPTATRTVGILMDDQRPVTAASRAFLDTVARARSSNQSLPVGVSWSA